LLLNHLYRQALLVLLTARVELPDQPTRNNQLLIQNLQHINPTFRQRQQYRDVHELVEMYQ
jgi:hypothetical protein